jgi:hypothetical protein
MGRTEQTVEMPLLPLLLRPTISAKAWEDMGKLDSEAWESLLSLASRHGVQPILYWRLYRSGHLGEIPGSVSERLHRDFLRSAAGNARLYHHLEEVLGRFRNAGVPVIVLKGAYLAQKVYEKEALRGMCDVDLLVMKTDLLRAAEILGSLGYRADRPFELEAEYAVTDHLPSFSRHADNRFEIHWSLTRPASPFSLDIDGLWERSQPVTIANTGVRALSPEDLLLHQCLHTAWRHRFAMGLRALCDIAETLRSFGTEMDWKAVKEMARLWKAERCLFLSLLLARDMVGAEVPDGILKKPGGRSADAMMRSLAEELVMAGEMRVAGLSPNFARAWAGTGPSEKAAALLKSLFPSRSFLATMYPVDPASPRVFLYYPVRLKDLLFRYGRSVWRLLRRDPGTEAAADWERRGNELSTWLEGG